jgi:hypothetical protein
LTFLHTTEDIAGDSLISVELRFGGSKASNGENSKRDEETHLESREGFKGENNEWFGNDCVENCSDMAIEETCEGNGPENRLVLPMLLRLLIMLA